MRGRKKKQRRICLDVDSLICGCMGPLQLPQEQLQQLPKVILEPDEIQALQYKDLEGLTMKEAAERMNISKTVFAGVYKRARHKQTDCLINGKILLVRCNKNTTKIESLEQQ